MPGLRVHRGDHPVRGDLAGDPPPPVGPVGALGGFHVLPGHQRQQRQRRRAPASSSSGLGERRHQRVRVVDQRRHQRVLARPGRPSRSAAYPGRGSRARCTPPRSASAAPGTCRPTRRIAEISWVMVSWVATASARIVESTARRRRPASTPVCLDHLPDRVVDPVRPLRLRHPPPPVHQRRRVEPRHPAATARRPPSTADHTGPPRRTPDPTARAAPATSAPPPSGSPATTDARSWRTGPRTPHPGTPRARCAARNANMLPAATRCPTTCPASHNSRSARSTPCTQRSSQTGTARASATPTARPGFSAPS